MFICNNSGHKLENLIYFHLLCDVQRERRESAHPVFKLVVRDCATLPHVFFFLLSRPIWCTDSFQRLMTSSIFGECIQIEWKNIQINMITDCFFLLRLFAAHSATLIYSRRKYSIYRRQWVYKTVFVSMKNALVQLFSFYCYVCICVDLAELES